jgi:zinc/manganese transport system permease protein
VVACLAALLLASDPHGGEELQSLLVGQILWVNTQQLASAAAIYAAIGLLWRPLAQRGVGFYTLFALAITTSVQLVGVYLVFASLILPALATLGRERGWWPVAFAVGAAGYSGGLVVSALTDLPTGPLVVVALAASALLAGLPAWIARTGTPSSKAN